MITENAIVTRVQGQYAWVSTERKSTCGACAAKSACGTAVLSEVVGRKVSQLRVLNSKDVISGDSVTVGLSEQALLKGSFLVYLVPLLFFFLFALFGNSMVEYKSDLITIILGGFGFAVGLLLARRYLNSQHHEQAFQAVILGINQHQNAVIDREIK